MFTNGQTSQLHMNSSTKTAITHYPSSLRVPIACRGPLPHVTTTDQPPVRVLLQDDDDGDDSEQAATATTTIQNKECGVCHQNQARYSCPKCPLQYCSVACYRDHGGDSNNSTSNCTERFYQDRVSQVLDWEVKERECETSNNNMMHLLRRVHQQGQSRWPRELLDENAFSISSNISHAAQVKETHLFELLVALEQEDEQQISRLLSQPEIKAAMRRGLGAGAGHQDQQQQMLLGELSEWVLKPWHPWWRTELSASTETARNEEGEQALNDDEDCDGDDCEPELIGGKTVDELILSLPAFRTICKSAVRPELQFHLLDILYGIAWMFHLYMGPYNAKAVAHEACTTLLVASTVLSSHDARYDSLPEVMIHCTKHSTQCYRNGGNGYCNVEWTVLANDLVSLCSCHRYVVRCLFEAMDILDKAMAMAKKRKDKETRLRWKRAKKKLDFYASWSCRDVSVFADMSREIQVWIETWSAQKEKHSAIAIPPEDAPSSDSYGHISLPLRTSSSSGMSAKIEPISVVREERKASSQVSMKKTLGVIM